MAEKIKSTIFYLVLFVFMWAVSITKFSLDYDLWARLIVGKYFFQTGHVLKQDFLSYTPTHIWYDHEWGSGVIFYITQHFLGIKGIIFLQTLLIFLTFFFVVQVIKLRGVKTSTAYNFLFYFFAIGAINYVFKAPIRCQLFSFLFFAVYLYLLERERKEVGKKLELIIGIPSIMLIWNNLHGGCVAGIGLILIYIIGEFLNRKPIKKYIYALLLSISVLPINPWGFRYIIFLIQANTMPRPDIIEWWGFFHKYNIHRYIKVKCFILMFIAIESIFAIKGLIEKKYNFDKTKFLLLTITLYLAVQHVKLIPLFVISAACFLYDDFYTVFNFITRNIFNKISIFKDLFVYITIIIFSVGQIKTKHFEGTVNFWKYPVLSVEFIKINNLKGNLQTNFGVGSYASYKLYPHNKIFMDGRYEEVYYDYMLPLLKNFYLHTKSWDKILKSFPPDLIIVDKEYPIYRILQTNKEWVLVYNKDINFAVFVRKKDLKKSYKMPVLDFDYYLNNVFLTDIDFSKK